MDFDNNNNENNYNNQVMNEYNNENINLDIDDNNKELIQQENFDKNNLFKKTNSEKTI